MQVILSSTKVASAEQFTGTAALDNAQSFHALLAAVSPRERATAAPAAKSGNTNAPGTRAATKKIPDDVSSVASGLSDSSAVTPQTTAPAKLVPVDMPSVMTQGDQPAANAKRGSAPSESGDVATLASIDDPSRGACAADQLLPGADDSKVKPADTANPADAAVDGGVATSVAANTGGEMNAAVMASVEQATVRAGSAGANSATKIESQSTNRQASAAGRRHDAAVDTAGKHSSDRPFTDISEPAVKSTEAINLSTLKPGQTQNNLNVSQPFNGGSTSQQITQPTTAAAVPGFDNPVAQPPQSSVASDSTSPLPQPAVATTQAFGETTAPALSGAQLIQTMHQSEMRLGMSSAEFGHISISTSLTRLSLSAQISLDHGELGRALALHLPAMEAKLGSSFGLPTRIELRDTGQPSGGTSDQSSSDGRQQQASTARFSSKLNLPSAAAAANTGSFPATSTPIPVSAVARLDINV